MTFNNSLNTYTIGGGPISGSGGITMNGSGLVVLTGANTFTGATTINAGVLSISADNNLGTAPAAALSNSITLNGGTLQLTATTTFETATINANRGITLGDSGGTIKLTTASTGTFAGSETAVQYDGVITGSGNLTVAGGSLTNSGTIGTGTAPYILELLGGASNYTGNTFITNAIVAFQAGGGGGTGPNNALPTTTVLSLTNNGWFDMNNGGSNQTLAGLTGDTTGEIGSTNGTSGDILTINPANGQTYVFNGFVGPIGILGKGPTPGSPISVVIAGTGTGTQIFTGTNTYAGTTTLTSGTLGIDSASAIGTGTFIINGGAIDNLTSPSAPITLSAHNNAQTWGPATAAPTSGFAYGGTGSLNLGTGAVTITGDTGTPFTETITANAANSGTTLTVGGPISPASTVTTADTLAVAGPGNVTLGGVISNGTGTGASLALTMSGTGMLVVSGANTYTGVTTINSGTLRVANASSTSATGTNSVNVNAGGTLAGNGGATSPGFISGGVTVASGGSISPSGGGVSGAPKHRRHAHRRGPHAQQHRRRQSQLPDQQQFVARRDRGQRQSGAARLRLHDV